jgi:hypothetical protein
VASFVSYDCGGGIENSARLSVANSTFSGSTAKGRFRSWNGVAVTSDAQSAVNSISSIFQNTQGGNVAVAAGSFISSGHNLFSDTPSVSLAPSDLVDTDRLLGPLADNGGPTRAQALMAGNPAINAGISVAGITTNQRRVARPSSGPTDVAAFQIRPPLVVVHAQRSGTGQNPTVLVLTFSLLLDATPAETLANYQLVQVDNGRAISVRPARYDAGSQSVTLRPKTRLLPCEACTLTVIGMPLGGLTTTGSAYLAGDSTPGSDYVATIT